MSVVACSEEEIDRTIEELREELAELWVPVALERTADRIVVHFPPCGDFGNVIRVYLGRSVGFPPWSINVPREYPESEEDTALEYERPASWPLRSLELGTVPAGYEELNPLQEDLIPSERARLALIVDYISDEGGSGGVTFALFSAAQVPTDGQVAVATPEEVELTTLEDYEAMVCG